MKVKSNMLCALVLLMSSAPLCAQKTEVTVRQGKVVAETQAATVRVEAGQKAVLMKDANPFVTVDSPLVRDALALYKLVEREKEHSDVRIDSVGIMVGRADEDEVIGAIYFELPNSGPTATDVMTLGYVAILGDVRIYDLRGSLCRVEETRLGDSATSYSIHFSEKVQPGEHFKVIVVVNLKDMPLLPGGAPAYWKEGPLLYFRTALNSPYALNYYRFILPESAILVDTNRDIVATDVVDGRMAVTMRNYTGPYYDGWCLVAMLFPRLDDTTLADIPDKYIGLRSTRDKETADMYRREMHKIRAGMKYADQSTPLAALLTCLSSCIDEDIDRFARVRYPEYPAEKTLANLEELRYFADLLDLLSVPPWPENPGSGYVHPIYLCRRGSQIDEFTQPIVCQNGKWYVHDSKSKQAVDFEPATSQDLAAARTKDYLCDWEVAGPYIQKGKKCNELFDIPFGPELSDVEVVWQPATIVSDDRHPVLVNIDKSIVHFDHSVAYLRTEIASDRQKAVRLEIYSDDGAKAWLNGKLIHENNVSRGIPEQPDAVNVTLERGINRLMLKVTEDILGSRATVRIGSDRAAGPRPTDKAIHPETQVQLSWVPAAAARSHRVYLGTDGNDLSLLAEVANARELQSLSLDPDHRYYWRVDEVLADGSCVEGDVWSFATSRHVARWTLDGHAQDQSLQAYHGALHGNPRWVPGVNNRAVALNKEDDYIIIPPMNLNTDTMTITLWVRTEEIVTNPGLVFTRESSASAGLWFNMKNNLRYNWNDDRETWSWDSGLCAPNQTWTFAALVVEPEQATIYVHDGTGMKSATHRHAHGQAKFDGVTYIGHDPRWGTVKGAIDEVRIFNRALDAREIEAICQKTNKTP